MSPVPEWFSAARAPTVAQLDGLADEDLHDLINWFSTAGNVGAGLGFWIDEMGRRRSQRVLNDIADATAVSIEQIATLAALTTQGAKQTGEMVDLTRTMTTLTWVSASVAVLALVVATLALLLR